MPSRQQVSPPAVPKLPRKAGYLSLVNLVQSIRLAPLAGFALVCGRYGHGNTTFAAKQRAAATVDAATDHHAATAGQTAQKPGLDDFCDHSVRVAVHQPVRKSHAICLTCVGSGLQPERLSPSLGREVGPRLEECVLKDNDARSKIAVVTVDGIITDTPGTRRQQHGGRHPGAAKRAKEDDRVKAVILKVDSPGGEVMASDEISRAIADFQTDDPVEAGTGKPGKPVVCSMGSLAASGGYYISVPCRWIVANDLTITGSIGVILHAWNYRGLMDKVGLAPVTYKSGKYKDMLSGERSTNEIPAEEREMVQGLIDETYRKFKNVVDGPEIRA